MYVLGGLVNINTADPQAISTLSKTGFIDGLINGVTFVLTPTVTVK